MNENKTYDYLDCVEVATKSALLVTSPDINPVFEQEVIRSARAMHHCEPAYNAMKAYVDKMHKTKAE